MYTSLLSRTRPPISGGAGDSDSGVGGDSSGGGGPKSCGGVVVAAVVVGELPFPSFCVSPSLPSQAQRRAKVVGLLRNILPSVLPSYSPSLLPSLLFLLSPPSLLPSLTITSGLCVPEKIHGVLGTRFKPRGDRLRRW